MAGATTKIQSERMLNSRLDHYCSPNSIKFLDQVRGSFVFGPWAVELILCLPEAAAVLRNGFLYSSDIYIDLEYFTHRNTGCAEYISQFYIFVTIC
jgi:hypothetical protein